MPFLFLVFSAFFASFAMTGCDTGTQPDRTTTTTKSRRSASASSSASSAAPRGDAVTVQVAYGSEKATWFEEQARAFEASGAKTKSGRPIHIEGKAMGSGEAMQGILAGTLKPQVFSPAAGAYVSLLNNSWLKQAGHTKALAPAGEPLVLSPVVIAMWKSMAEALGWPDKPVSWSEMLTVARDKQGWARHGHPEWGRFKLGHTHPEYSNSGLLAVLAEAYAGAKKIRGLEVADLDAKPTLELLSAIEGTVIHYGKSTGFFADNMLARGPSYISGAVLYENLVVESYAKKSGAMPIVAVYPAEGTFWSDHPYCILDADWVSDEQRDGAQAFLAFLRSRPAQERALALGFRPADTAIAVTAPIDAAHGCDPKQPQTLLELPSAEVLEKLIAVWQTTKKATDVVFVFDKSGSMQGKPLADAQSGAKSFIELLHDRDEVTLLFFDGQIYPAVGPFKVGEKKKELLTRIDGIVAGGQTALYDVIAEAYGLATKRAATEPGRIHAVVLMTDGNDQGSKLTFEQLLPKFASDEAAVKVFTIAYGSAVDPKVLARVSDAAKGSAVSGSPENIVNVYKDMAAFF